MQASLPPFTSLARFANMYMYMYLMFGSTFHARPHSSTLGKAQDTEIFRNMDHFEKVTTPVLYLHVLMYTQVCAGVYCLIGMGVPDKILGGFS